MKNEFLTSRKEHGLLKNRVGQVLHFSLIATLLYSASIHQVQASCLPRGAVSVELPATKWVPTAYGSAPSVIKEHYAGVSQQYFISNITSDGVFYTNRAKSDYVKISINTLNNITDNYGTYQSVSANAIHSCA